MSVLYYGRIIYMRRSISSVGSFQSRLLEKGCVFGIIKDNIAKGKY